MAGASSRLDLNHWLSLHPSGKLEAMTGVIVEAEEETWRVLVVSDTRLEEYEVWPDGLRVLTAVIDLD